MSATDLASAHVVGVRPFQAIVRRLIPSVRVLAVAVAAIAAIVLLAPSWLIVREPLARADALLVMCGAPVYQDRVQHAGRLLQQGVADRILLSDDGVRRGWSRPLQRNPMSTEAAQIDLEAMGISRDHVEVLPGRVHSTWDEAQSAIRYAREHGLRSILAVTSPYHTRRTLWTLRQASSDDRIAIGVDPVPPTRTTPGPFTWWTRRAGWSMVGGELVKLPYYWLSYR